ncbi:MAG: ACT domain-containing protein [Clostridia bacterium]|nr:ACT domain-containing protein [Clostridia bacterium]
MKAILTVVGQDKPGIIAGVSTMLAGHNVNIEDISQTIMQGNFTMIMAVDLAGADIPLADLVGECGSLGKALGVEIHLQHEEIFKTMHSI